MSPRGPSPLPETNTKRKAPEEVAQRVPLFRSRIARALALTGALFSGSAGLSNHAEAGNSGTGPERTIRLVKKPDGSVGAHITTDTPLSPPLANGGEVNQRFFVFDNKQVGIDSNNVQWLTGDKLAADLAVVGGQGSGNLDRSMTDFSGPGIRSVASASQASGELDRTRRDENSVTCAAVPRAVTQQGQRLTPVTPGNPAAGYRPSIDIDPMFADVLVDSTSGLPAIIEVDPTWTTDMGDGTEWVLEMTFEDQNFHPVIRKRLCSTLPATTEKLEIANPGGPDGTRYYVKLKNINTVQEFDVKTGGVGFY